MIRKPHLASAAVALSLAAITTLAWPASSLAAVSCSYSGSDKLLTISAADAFAGITRSGTAIEVDDGFRQVSCGGGMPNVHNTDRVQVSHTGRSGDRIDLAGGPFAPGATSGPGATDEIKFAYTGPTTIDIHGSGGPDQLTLGPANGINLNGDGDVDVTGPFTMVVLEGAAGDDVLAPQSDWTGTGAHLILAGGGGNDHLTAPPGGGVLHGGEGRDVINGSARADSITGGEGRDLIRAGRGRDIVRAIDGTRDRIICGGGFDRVKVDTVDKLKGCERLIVVKGPRR
jgi:Ca2+-binding RTX toxin-like protein